MLYEVITGAETVTVTLTGTSDAAVGVSGTPATVTITDNDTATLTVGDVTVNEAARITSYNVCYTKLLRLETLDAQISAGNAFTAIQASIGTSDATATITDNETATVTISATDAAAAETGSDPGQFTVDP